MTIKVDTTINEIKVAGGYYSDLPINTSSTITASNIVTSATGTAGAFTVNGAFTATAAGTIAGVATLGATGTAGYTALGSGGPRIISGTLAPPINPTGVSAPLGSLFINLGATGVTNRVYINTDGATAWIFLGTSGA